MISAGYLTDWPLSDGWGKVASLMENNIETPTTETETTATDGRYAELQRLVAAMAPDFEKFYKDGNKAAGTRVRNAMQELKTLAQTIRTEVQAIKNEGKAPTEGDGEN